MPINPLRTRFEPSSVLIAACTYPMGWLKSLTVRTGPPGCRPLSFSEMSHGVEVEEVAVDAAGPADDLERRRQLGQDVVELVLLVDQRLLDAFEMADGALQQRPVVGQQVGDGARGVADVGDRAGDRVGAVLQPGDQLLEVLSRVSSNCCWCLTVVSSTVFRLLDHLADRLVAIGQRRRSADAVWSRMSLMVPPWPWKIVMIDWAMLLTLSGSSARNSGPEPADQRVEVERGLGAFERDGAAGRQPLVAVAALELQVAVADQVQVADRRGRRLEQLQRAIDVEVDPHRWSAVDAARPWRPCRPPRRTRGRTGRPAGRWRW